jgi:beta-glucosidase
MMLNKEMKWVVEPGAFTVMIGASCEDIKLKSTFEVIK